MRITNDVRPMSYEEIKDLWNNNGNGEKYLSDMITATVLPFGSRHLEATTMVSIDFISEEGFDASIPKRDWTLGLRIDFTLLSGTTGVFCYGYFEAYWDGKWPVIECCFMDDGDALWVK